MDDIGAFLARNLLEEFNIEVEYVGDERPKTLKLNPNTKEYDMVLSVLRRYPGVKFAQAMRMLIRAGFASYQRSMNNG